MQDVLIAKLYWKYDKHKSYIIRMVAIMSNNTLIEEECEISKTYDMKKKERELEQSILNLEAKIIKKIMENIGYKLTNIKISHPNNITLAQNHFPKLLYFLKEAKN